ncbi:PQQ-binding-like beta-propeller repeat protein [Xylella fastidiosa]|uniref:outer membrane protein assembly factor BamB family protein n=1 Tax=Xylella fastidiosa TaxID=2371 RepID=UPI0005711C1A|nr:PQQ-binding-like beta-propeller repeat protein [Xylella fastidiosa]
MQWSLSTQGGLPASSTIDNHSLYVSSSNGTLNKIDTQTGSLLWSIPLSNYTGNPHSLSLKSTAIAPQSIVVGDQNSGTLLALNKTSGTLLWKTTIEPNLNAKITSPPTIYEDRVYVGVSSGKSQSNIAALDLKTGQPLWQSNSVPNGAVINGPLTINPSKKRLYALTSNSGQASPLHNHTDTLLVLDMKNGALLLKQSLKESTDPNTDNANKNGAILFTLNINGTTRDVAAIPEAQGHYQVLDANNGTILWSTDITPGSTNRIVASSFNPYKSQIYVISNANNAQIHNGYYLTALDAKTGTILWNTKVHGNKPINAKLNTGGGIASSPDIIYTSSPNGKITMLEANTGKILWSFDTHASIISAPVMTNDALYVGATFTHNTGKLYKFTTQEHLKINNLQHNQQHSLINHISEQKETNGNSDSHGDSHSGEGSWSESGSGSWSYSHPSGGGSSYGSSYGSGQGSGGGYSSGNGQNSGGVNYGSGSDSRYGANTTR